MTDFSYKELVILLGYYFYGNKNKTNSLKIFSDKFNSYFNKDISTQTISYAITIFKNLDPSFIADPIVPENKNFNIVWNDYVTKNKKEKLKKKYMDFKKGIKEDESPNLIYDDKDFENKLQECLSKNNIVIINDTPKELYEDYISISHTYKRDCNVSSNALKSANYKCEFDNNHKTFIRKNIDIDYTEGHHLVPLMYQSIFDTNLDVEANIVSLCSTCHNNLHYGRDYVTILSKLYEEKKERLRKCGIDITFKRLIDMYK